MPAATLAHAFERYVDLVRHIDDVYYVTAHEPRRPDIYTYLREQDRASVRQIMQAEAAVDDEFPELLIDFHLVFLDGRRIEDFSRPIPDLFYSRPGLDTQGAKRGKL
jgi:hypothetical protein